MRIGRLRKTRFIAFVVAFSILVSVVGLRHISSSRTFQFFGELIARVDTPQKAVALTFDDGPTADATDQILAILDQENIKATFFVTGAELERDLNQGKKIVAAGHELGNHSYSHSRMFLVTPSFVQQEIETTDRLIRDAGYQREILFRPPYAKKLFALPYYLSKTDRKSITWDVEPDSYPDIAADADKIAAHVLSKTRPGSIILLHVMYPNRRESMRSVNKIVQGLKAQGYSFKTVAELLSLRNTEASLIYHKLGRIDMVRQAKIVPLRSRQVFSIGLSDISKTNSPGWPKALKVPRDIRPDANRCEEIEDTEMRDNASENQRQVTENCFSTPSNSLGHHLKRHNNWEILRSWRWSIVHGVSDAPQLVRTTKHHSETSRDDAPPLEKLLISTT